MIQENNYRQIFQNLDIQQMNKTISPLKKRTDKVNLKDRFSKIISVYVPNDDAEKVLLRFDDEMELETQDHYLKTLLQSLGDGLCYQVECMGSWQNFLGRKGGKVICSCIYKSTMFVVFDGENQIFRLIISERELQFERIWFPAVQSFSLFPIDIHCNGESIYVSGKISVSPDSVQYMIVQYDMNENVIAYTRRYSFPKFSKFDIDRDGNLIILSPSINVDGSNSQISKLTSRFDSRKYYITLGDNQSTYLPLYVVAHGSSNKTWVSMKKLSADNNGQPEYRLMCFRCCFNYIDGNMSQLRTVLDSSRWKMADFNIGPMVVLDNHILAIDEQHHNLCYISWNEAEGYPIVKKISAPNCPYLINMCSDGTEYAFLFTENSVFRFRFQEQLIKESELFV